MAHRIVWKHESSVNVVIYERGDIPIPGMWIEEKRIVRNTLVLRGRGEVRVYQVREWLSQKECRATLMSVNYDTGERIVKI